jgi:hypothetical protein
MITKPTFVIMNFCKKDKLVLEPTTIKKNITIASTYQTLTTTKLIKLVKHKS